MLALMDAGLFSRPVFVNLSASWPKTRSLAQLRGWKKTLLSLAFRLGV